MAAQLPGGYTGPSSKDDARDGRLKLNITLEEVRTTRLSDPPGFPTACNSSSRFVCSSPLFACSFAIPPCAFLQRIGKEWRNQALEACDLPVKAYWVCRQEAGFGVFWKCQGASEAMKKCVADYTGNTEKWEAYRAEQLSVLAPAYFNHRARMLDAKLSHYKELEESGKTTAAAGR